MLAAVYGIPSEVLESGHEDLTKWCTEHELTTDKHRGDIFYNPLNRCNHLNKKEWKCFAVAFNWNSQQSGKLMHYLTVRLARTEGSEEADPDLFGMFNSPAHLGEEVQWLYDFF